MILENAKAHILNEINGLYNSLKTDYGYENIADDFIQKRLLFAKDLLGEGNQYIDGLTMDAVNEHLFELMISIRYSGPAFPLGLNDDNKDTLVFQFKHFFNHFLYPENVSLTGRFFAVLQKHLFGYLNDEDQPVYCMPLRHCGMLIGCAAYFPHAFCQAKGEHYLFLTNCQQQDEVWAVVHQYGSS